MRGVPYYTCAIARSYTQTAAKAFCKLLSRKMPYPNLLVSSNEPSNANSLPTREILISNQSFALYPYVITARIRKLIAYFLGVKSVCWLLACPALNRKFVA